MANDNNNDDNGNGNNQTSDSDDQGISGTSVLKIVSLATIGYTPELLQFNEGERRLSPKFFFLFFLFLVDFADMVFDLILSVRTIMFRTEGAGVVLGAILISTTILGRVVSALYGLWVSRYPPDEEEAFRWFALMEMTVFFLEDGAAILVLANSTGGMTIVETISMLLTIVCGVCYIGFIAFDVIRHTLKEGVDVIGFLQFALLPAVCAVFQIFIFITEVILSKDDDPPLSGGLEIAAFVVYGITAVVLGGTATLLFAGGVLRS